MKFYNLFFITTLFYANAFPSKRSDKTICRKVPQQKLEQQCNLEELVVKTANVVQQCKDVFATHCKETFSPVPLVPFRTSRIVGSTSLVINGEGSHYSKREDVHHGLSTGRTCKKVKEKECYNVPEEKIVKTQVCKDIASTIYIEECDQIVESPKVEAKPSDVELVEIPVVEVANDDTAEEQTIEKLSAVELKITPAVVQVEISKGLKNNNEDVVQQKIAATTPKSKKQKQKRRQRNKPKAKVTHNFTTARSVEREAKAYAKIQSQVAGAKETIAAVRKSVANKEIDFTEAKETIEGVVSLLGELSKKSKNLEKNNNS